MATTRKTIIITEQQNEWIEHRVANGDFADDSGYIQDLICRDQARCGEIERIRDELIRGEQSGKPRAFDDALFKKMMAAKYRGISR